MINHGNVKVPVICAFTLYPPRAYSASLYARGQSLSSCVQTLAKNDLVHIVDGYMHEVVLNPRVSCKSSCVYPLP